MRFIKKGREPNLLRLYREEDYATFKGLPEQTHKVLKDQLLCEQGFTCAYCMQNITYDNMKIEHWLPQSANRDKSSTLNYVNLLGCCIGNDKEGFGPALQTCDTKKANQPLKYSPAVNRDDINNKIKYLVSGKIESDDITFNEQINSVLNLNLKMMVDNRLGALGVIKSKLASKKGPRTKAEIQKMLLLVSNKKPTGKYFAYYGFLMDYLEKRLKKM